MTRVGWTRLVLGAAGTVLLLVGVVLALRLGLGDLVSVGLWLGGGVLAHDLLLAPVVVGLGVLGAMFLPPWAKAPLAVGAVVLLTVTLAVFPTISRFGAKASDPTLLDKPYAQSWVLFAVLVALGVASGSLLMRRRGRARHGT